MYNWFALLYTWNQYNIVSQLYIFFLKEWSDSILCILLGCLNSVSWELHKSQHILAFPDSLGQTPLKSNYGVFFWFCPTMQTNSSSFFVV